MVNNNNLTTLMISSAKLRRNGYGQLFKSTKKHGKLFKSTKMQENGLFCPFSCIFCIYD